MADIKIIFYDYRCMWIVLLAMFYGVHWGLSGGASMVKGEPHSFRSPSNIVNKVANSVLVSFFIPIFVTFYLYD